MKRNNRVFNAIVCALIMMSGANASPSDGEAQNSDIKAMIRQNVLSFNSVSFKYNLYDKSRHITQDNKLTDFYEQKVKGSLSFINGAAPQGLLVELLFPKDKNEFVFHLRKTIFYSPETMRILYQYPNTDTQSPPKFSAGAFPGWKSYYSKANIVPNYFRELPDIADAWLFTTSKGPIYLSEAIKEAKIDVAEASVESSIGKIYFDRQSLHPKKWEIFQTDDDGKAVAVMIRITYGEYADINNRPFPCRIRIERYRNGELYSDKLYEVQPESVKINQTDERYLSFNIPAGTTVFDQINNIDYIATEVSDVNQTAEKITEILNDMLEEAENDGGKNKDK